MEEEMSRKVCACYLRVSTMDQAEHGFSLPAQQERLKAYCTAKGWDIYKMYIDDGYSGKDLDRPEIKLLIEDAMQKCFDQVAVIKLDRLSRSQKDSLYLIEDVFNKYDIGFSSIAESFDTHTPFGKASLGMMSVFAQLEREMIVERSKMGKREAAKQGRYIGGFFPYGYDHENGKGLSINPDQAEVVRFIYRLYLTGNYGFQAIANILNEKKIPTQRDAQGWDRNVIKTMLLTPYHVGQLPHLDEVYEGNHEAIIDMDTYEKTVRMIKNRSVPRPTKADDNLLTGFIYCGECGARMRYRVRNWPGGGQKHYYRCYTANGDIHMSKAKFCHSGSKSVDEMNNVVIHYLLELSANEKLLRELIKEKPKTHKFDENNLLKSELSDIQKKLKKWYAAFESDRIDQEELRDHMRGLHKRRSEIETKLSEITATDKASIEDRETKLQAVSTVRNLGKVWPAFTADEKRVILASLIKKVTVFKDGRVDVTLIF